MSVIVQIHACLVSNLFYRLTILKENLWAGPKDLSVLHTYATQLLSNNKKKVIKKKKRQRKSTTWSCNSTSVIYSICSQMCYHCC